MRALVLGLLLSTAAGPALMAQEPGAARQPLPDTLGNVPRDTTAAALPDTAGAVLGDTLRVLPADTTGADSAAAVDTTLQKLRNRTPLFPEDVDPYTLLGRGRPALVLERDDLGGWPAATLAEILPRLQLLLVDDQGGPGFFQDLRFPSGDASATRLHLDGRPLESPLGGAADLRTIPLAALERIEVYPGTASVTGGAEAGWINLVTRTHLTPQPNSALRFDLGSFGREGFGATVGRWFGSRLSFFANLHFDDGNTFTRVGSADRSRYWVRGRYYLARRHFVEAGYGSSGVTTDTRRQQVLPPSPFTQKEDRREQRFQALYRGRVGPVTASARYFSDSFEEREAFVLEGVTQLIGNFDRRGARGTVRLDVARGTAEAGVEWQEEDLDSEAPLFEAVDVPADDSSPLRVATPLSRTGVFVGTEQSFDSLSVSGQARFDRFELTGGEESEPAFSAEARYAGWRGLSPFVRVARSARAPSFVEQAVLVRAGETEGIRASTATELRAGSGWSRDAFSAELSVFERRGSDAVVWLPPTAWRAATGEETVRVGPPTNEDLAEGAFATLNVIDLRARGVNATFGVPLPFGVRGEGMALLQSVEDDDGRRIPYIPREAALGRLTFEQRFFPSQNLRVRASLDGRVIGKRTTVSGEDLPAYSLVDGLLRVQLIGFTFGLSAHNIFDLIYNSEERFSLPRRIVNFEVYWEFWN